MKLNIINFQSQTWDLNAECNLNIQRKKTQQSYTWLHLQFTNEAQVQNTNGSIIHFLLWQPLVARGQVLSSL